METLRNNPSVMSGKAQVREMVHTAALTFSQMASFSFSSLVIRREKEAQVSGL